MSKEGGDNLSEIKISLAAARVNADMTQSEVAEKMHVSKQTIVNWERGKIIPGTAQLNFLCMLYRFPVDNIFLPSECTLSASNGE